MTLRSSESFPMLPLTGLPTSMNTESIVVGVGGAAPMLKSGSVHVGWIVRNLLTPVPTVWLAQLGGKLVAQSALPSKCWATLTPLKVSRVLPLMSFVMSSPALNAPSVNRIVVPSGDHTQLRSPTFIVVEKGV